MRKLLALLLFALPLRAQTVANPSFEAPATLGQAGSAGPWSYGPVPSWTLTGSGGLWQPSSLFTLPVPDGSTILWLGKGSISQDLGVAAQANTIYTLTVWTGRRSDVWETPTNSYTISFAGCTQTAQLSTIPVGTFTKQVLTCPVGATPPAGNLSVALGCDGPQCAFDNLSLTVTLPGPFVLKLPGLTNLTFLLSDPSQLPVCKPSEGACSLIIAVCFTDSGQCANGVKGSVSVVKVTNSSTTSTAVIQASP